MTNITELKLSEVFDSYTERNGQKLNILQPISGINILVGPNNSGKSRFMRALSNQGEFLVNILNYNNNEFTEKLSIILYDIYNKFLEENATSINEINIEKIRDLVKLPDFLSLSVDSYSGYRSLFQKWSDMKGIRSYSCQTEDGAIRVLETIKTKSREALQICESIPVFGVDTAPKKVYIPVLRGLRPINDQIEDNYAERTFSDYFQPRNNDNPEVFTGLTFYQKLIDMLLGDNNDRKTISRYQKFISAAFFENRPVSLIPNIKNKVIVVKIGTEKEQPIFNLGDGIQSAIILSFLPFITKKPTFFFIEEPEMFLHPGLQRKILNFFASQNQHTFFLTTHSNHFLDLTIDIKDISVFTFQKQLTNEENNDELTPKFIVEAVDGSNNSSLELLGVRNSSVFLVNATIWVEGITDRWYLRKMLESYMDNSTKSNPKFKKFEEDVHYSFVEYGGSNITHWSFLEDYEEHPIEVTRLCSKAIVIIDSDGNSKLVRKEKLLEVLDDRLITIPGREIENLLPYNVLKKVVLEFENTPDKVLPSYDQSLYKDKKLGLFIENNVLKKEIVRTGGYKDESGTIKSKRSFCEKACPLIEFDALDDDTKAMIIKIYDFINKQNS